MAGLNAAGQSTPEIERKRQMARLLAQNAMTPQQTGPNSSMLQALVPLAMALASKRTMGEADEEQDAYAQKRQSELANILAAGQGTPAVPASPAMIPLTPNDDEGNPNMSLPATPAIPAKAGGREAMVKAMLGSSFPDLQQAGLSASLTPQARWETVQGPRGARISRNTVTGEERQVIAPERPGAGAGTGGVRLSPTAQKELFEADESIQAGNNVMTLLSEAEKINNRRLDPKTGKWVVADEAKADAYSGPTADLRVLASRVLPGKYEGADAATSLDNIVRGQALESLKSIFGGMPTEGERKILIELQASLEKTPEQRADILKRAREAAQRRLQFNAKKAKSLREGTYFKESMTDPAGDDGWSIEVVP